MPPAKVVVLGSGALLLVLGYAVASIAEGQPSTPIAIGAIGTLEGAPSAAVRAELATALEEVGGFRVTPGPRADYVIRGSVLRLASHDVPGGHEVQCEVSLIVSDARGERVRALLTGRAGARGGGQTEVRDAALRAAIRSAIRPLPSGLASARGEL
jgi:hypothetical protein